MSHSKNKRVNITDAFCRAAVVKPGQNMTVYSDDALRGFCLVVTKGGAKTFAVRYTLKEGDEAGKQVRLTLGPYLGRDGVSVAEWRAEAAKAIGDAARGIDKASTRRGQREAITIAALVDRYMKEHAVSKRSGETDRARFDRHILPLWKHRKAASIRRGDVTELLAPIEFGDASKKLPPRPAEAHGTLRLIQKLFAFGIDIEAVTTHPAMRMKLASKVKPRERELSSAADLRAFWALTEGDSYMPANYAAALRFQLLTGTRPNEAAGLPKSELDLDANEWTLPEARSKNKRAHMIPLTPTLRSIIDSQIAAEKARRLESEKAGKPVRVSSYIFPATRGGRFTDKCRKTMLDDALDAFARDGGKLARFTPHDLRRTAETAMAADGVLKEYRDRLLNHVDSSVGGKSYNKHDYKEEKRQAMLRLEAFITDRRASPSPNNVTPITRKGKKTAKAA